MTCLPVGSAIRVGASWPGAESCPTSCVTSGMISGAVFTWSGMTLSSRSACAGAMSTTATASSISFSCSSVAVTRMRLFGASATSEGLGREENLRSAIRSVTRLWMPGNAVSVRVFFRTITRRWRDRPCGRSARSCFTSASMRARWSWLAVTMRRPDPVSARILACATVPAEPSAVWLR